MESSKVKVTHINYWKWFLIHSCWPFILSVTKLHIPIPHKSACAILISGSKGQTLRLLQSFLEIVSSLLLLSLYIYHNQTSHRLPMRQWWTLSILVSRSKVRVTGFWCITPFRVSPYTYLHETSHKLPKSRGCDICFNSTALVKIHLLYTWSWWNILENGTILRPLPCPLTYFSFRFAASISGHISLNLLALPLPRKCLGILVSLWLVVRTSLRLYAWTPLHDKGFICLWEGPETC